MGFKKKCFRYEGLRYAHLLIHGIQRFYCPSLGDETTSTSDKQRE